MDPDLMNLIQNPVGTLIAKGFNIPQDQSFNGPQDIVNYLINSGQADQNALNRGQQIARQFGYKI